MKLQATWTNDGAADGSIDNDLRWIPAIDEELEWEGCRWVPAVDRSSIQLTYVQAAGDPLSQASTLVKDQTR
jgi:hypothetical protein